MKVDNIIDCVTKMKDRGVIFLDVPDSYYVTLGESLRQAKVTIDEDFETIRRLKILVDYDD